MAWALAHARDADCSERSRLEGAVAGTVREVLEIVLTQRVAAEAPEDAVSVAIGDALPDAAVAVPAVAGARAVLGAVRAVLERLAATVAAHDRAVAVDGATLDVFEGR